MQRQCQAARPSALTRMMKLPGYRRWQLACTTRRTATLLHRCPTLLQVPPRQRHTRRQRPSLLSRPLRFSPLHTLYQLLLVPASPRCHSLAVFLSSLLSLPLLEPVLRQARRAIFSQHQLLMLGCLMLLRHECPGSGCLCLQLRS